MVTPIISKPSIIPIIISVKQSIFKQKTAEYLAKIYCSSDSIESAFGKLKQKINRTAEPPHSQQQMTVFVLSLASIGSAYLEQEIKK